jgi:hypothetical protein
MDVLVLDDEYYLKGYPGEGRGMGDGGGFGAGRGSGAGSGFLLGAGYAIGECPIMDTDDTDSGYLFHGKGIGYGARFSYDK